MLGSRKRLEEILSNYTELVNEVKNINLEIEELKADYQGTKAIDYGEKTGQTYKISNPVENEVINKEDRIEHLERIKRSKEIIIEKVNNSLNVLNEKEKRIIELRYFQLKGKSWTHVCRKVDLCEAWARKLRNKALEKMLPIVFVAEYRKSNGIIAKKSIE